MKKIQAVIIAASAVLLAACGSAGTPSSTETNMTGYTTQSVADFAKTIATPGVVVVDVRTPSEFSGLHLPAAMNIDVEGADFASQIAGLDKSVTYAVYCHSGRRSAIAAEQMAAAGFTHIYNLDGGIQAWQAANQPLEIY